MPLVRNVLIPAILVVLTVLGGAALMATAPSVAPSIPEVVPITVRIQEIEPGPLEMIVESQGTVSPTTVTELIPEVSGRVEWISPSLVAGGSFDAGDVLLRIDQRDYVSAVQRAEANLSRAEAEFEHARFDYKRLQQLTARKLASRSQLETALRTARVTEAALADARIALEQARLDLSRTRLMAPFKGLVRSERVDLGQFVARGTSIATVYAADQLEVRLPVADTQLAYLDVPVGLQGQIPPERAPRVTLASRFAGRDYTWQAHLHRIEAEIDSKSRMVTVVARIDISDAETPPAVGMFVNARIHGRTVDNVVVVPRSALRNDNRVLIVDGQNRLRFRKVEPLRLYGDQVVLKSGLAAGERLCLSPLQTPIDGMPVRMARADGEPMTPSA